MPLRGSYSVYGVPSTSLLRSSAFIGCVSLSESPSNWQFQHIDGAGPSYFQSCFTRVADMPSRRRLRSSGSDRLHVAIIRRSTVGSRTFTASGAAVWNDLPAYVTAAPSLAVFRQRLKTFLFPRSYPDIVTTYKLCICLLYLCGPSNNFII